MKTIFLLFLVGLLLMGCSVLPNSTRPPQSAPAMAATLAVPDTARPAGIPTATQWLPYNPNYSAQGCGEFTATLPVQGTENLSQLEISRTLFETYLAHYRAPDLGGLCRLEDFEVEQVKEQFANLAGEQHVDFVNTVTYSVQVAEAPTDWAAGNGELSSNGWIVHKFLIIGVIKGPEEYVLKLIGTGP